MNRVGRATAILYVGVIALILSAQLSTKSWIVLTIPLFGMGIAMSQSFTNNRSLWAIAILSGVIGYSSQYLGDVLQNPIFLVGYGLAIVTGTAVAEVHRNACRGIEIK